MMEVNLKFTCDGCGIIKEIGMTPTLPNIPRLNVNILPEKWFYVQTSQEGKATNGLYCENHSSEIKHAIVLEVP